MSEEKEEERQRGAEAEREDAEARDPLAVERREAARARILGGRARSAGCGWSGEEGEKEKKEEVGRKGGRKGGACVWRKREKKAWCVLDFSVAILSLSLSVVVAPGRPEQGGELASKRKRV